MVQRKGQNSKFTFPDPNSIFGISSLLRTVSVQPDIIDLLHKGHCWLSIRSLQGRNNPYDKAMIRQDPQRTSSHCLWFYLVITILSGWTQLRIIQLRDRNACMGMLNDLNSRLTHHPTLGSKGHHVLSCNSTNPDNIDGSFTIKQNARDRWDTVLVGINGRSIAIIHYWM